MIFLLDLIVLAAVAGIALLFFTQVAVPLWRGTPLFPNFKPDSPLKQQVEEAQEELEHKTELVELQEQLEEINRRKAELEKK